MADLETELMLRVAAGDDAAFEELVGRVLPRLLGYFRRLGFRRRLFGCLHGNLGLLCRRRGRCFFVGRSRLLLGSRSPIQ